MKKIMFIKKAGKVKQRLVLILLTLILVLVAIPYAPKAYKVLSEWKQENDRITRNSALIKSENAALKKQEQLFQKYEITHLELHDNAISFLQAEARTNKLKIKYGSCENPISPTPTAKPKSNYFNLDFEKYRPSSSKTEYEQFVSDCLRLKEHKTSFNLFDSEISKINLLIAENINSRDTAIQKLVQSLDARVKNYQQALSIAEKTK